jgi:hypothetical protein
VSADGLKRERLKIGAAGSEHLDDESFEFVVGEGVGHVTELEADAFVTEFQQDADALRFGFSDLRNGQLSAQEDSLRFAAVFDKRAEILHVERRRKDVVELCAKLLGGIGKGMTNDEIPNDERMTKSE